MSLLDVVCSLLSLNMKLLAGIIRDYNIQTVADLSASEMNWQPHIEGSPLCATICSIDSI
jgi:hypothetical protein